MYQSDGNAIYFTSGEPALKARNMRKNNNVSITIPFWKNTLHKLGKVEFLDRNHEEIQANLKRFLDYEEKMIDTSESIYLKVTPGKKIATFGVGIKLLQMRKPEKARNLIDWG
jgi:hypothetical protein